MRLQWLTVWSGKRELGYHLENMQFSWRMADNNLVTQSCKGVPGDWPWDTKPLGHCWTGNFNRGKGFVIFKGDFMGKILIPVYQLLHKVSALQSYPFWTNVKTKKGINDEYRGLSHIRDGDFGDEKCVLSGMKGNLGINPGRFPSQSFHWGWEWFGPLYMETKQRCAVAIINCHVFLLTELTVMNEQN